MKNKLLILSLILSIFATSCASRKVNKSETKETEKTTVEVTAEVNTKVNENTKVIDTSTIDEIEIVPVDNSKPIIYNNQKIFNAKIRHSKKKNNIISNKVVETQHKAKKEWLTMVKTNKTVEVKQLDKKANYFWLLWLLLLIPFYYLYKRFFS